jgi:hypothetical protein
MNNITEKTVELIEFFVKGIDKINVYAIIIHSGMFFYENLGCRLL